MKVLHVIPAAWHYYDDIQAEAFQLVDVESSMGVYAIAYTIEYQNPNKAVPATSEKEREGKFTPSTTSVQSAIFKRRAAPQYKGKVSDVEIETDMATFDVVHVHAPIFGAIGRVMNWKKLYPNLKIFVTIHRPSRKTDFFTLVFAIYNKVMLPKLLAVCSAIITPSMEMLHRSYKTTVDSYVDKVVEVDDSELFVGEKLSETVPQWKTFKMKEIVAYKCIILYNNLYGYSLY